MPFFNVDDVSLFYQVTGDGIPIVLIHPPVLTSENFFYQINELSKKFKVITFDIRGHGKSSSSEKPLSYHLIAEDITKLLDHLQINKVYIGGYSTGGSLALEYMLSFPDRTLGGIVISGMSEVKRGTLKDKIKLGISLTENDAIPLIALSISMTNSNDKKMFWRLFNSSIQSEAQNSEQYYRYSLSYNCTGQIKNIEQPVLLVYGEKDKEFHPYAKILAKRLVRNERKVVNGVKHQIPTKAAGELNRYIQEFITQHNK